MSYWTGFTYATNWADYGNGYEPGAFKIDGDRVYLKGAVTYTGGDTVSDSPNLLTTLPSGFIPPNIEQFPVFSGDVAGDGPLSGSNIQVRIDTDGNIYLMQDYGAEGGSGPAILDGISFSILS